MRNIFQKTAVLLVVFALVSIYTVSMAAISKNILKEKIVTELDWQLLLLHFDDLATEAFEQKALPLKNITYDRKSKKIKALFSISEDFMREDLSSQANWFRARIYQIAYLLSKIDKKIEVNDLVAEFSGIPKRSGIAKKIEVQYEQGSFKAAITELHIGKVLETFKFDLKEINK